MVEKKLLKHDDWVQVWSGRWGILSCYHFAEQDTRQVTFHRRPYLTQTITFTRKGRSQSWARQSDLQVLSRLLAKEIDRKGKSEVLKTCNELKKQARSLLAYIKQHEKKEIGERVYREFWRRVTPYYRAHDTVKYVVEGLRPVRLIEYLPYYQDARKYSEPVFDRTEDFMIAMAKQISQKTGYSSSLILCLLPDEMIRYFRKHVLPAKSVLLARNTVFGVYFDRRRSMMFEADEVKKVENVMLAVGRQMLLRGTSAYPGKVRGKVRIIKNPGRERIFRRGEILVTGMTRPDFLPLMHKAAAFVTDTGGILSHAAISAREMEKPCVIGTRVATKVLKNGDRVEVDAIKGIVRKLG